MRCVTTILIELNKQNHVKHLTIDAHYSAACDLQGNDVIFTKGIPTSLATSKVVERLLREAHSNSVEIKN